MKKLVLILFLLNYINASSQVKDSDPFGDSKPIKTKKIKKGKIKLEPFASDPFAIKKNNEERNYFNKKLPITNVYDTINQIDFSQFPYKKYSEFYKPTAEIIHQGKLISYKGFHDDNKVKKHFELLLVNNKKYYYQEFDTLGNYNFNGFLYKEDTSKNIFDTVYNYDLDGQIVGLTVTIKKIHKLVKDKPKIKINPLKDSIETINNSDPFAISLNKKYIDSIDYIYSTKNITNSDTLNLLVTGILPFNNSSNKPLFKEVLNCKYHLINLKAFYNESKTNKCFELNCIDEGNYFYEEFDTLGNVLFKGELISKVKGKSRQDTTLKDNGFCGYNSFFQLFFVLYKGENILEYNNSKYYKGSYFNNLKEGVWNEFLTYVDFENNTPEIIYQYSKGNIIKSDTINEVLKSKINEKILWNEFGLVMKTGNNKSNKNYPNWSRYDTTLNNFAYTFYNTNRFKYIFREFVFGKEEGTWKIENKKLALIYEDKKNNRKVKRIIPIIHLSKNCLVVDYKNDKFEKIN